MATSTSDSSEPLAGAGPDRCPSEERFRSAFEHTNVPMVLTDLNHRFVRANDAFARLFGCTPVEILTLSMADVTHPDDVAESLARRQALLAGDAAHFQMEKRYLHKDGRVLWGLTNVSLIRDAQGAPQQYVGQVQDITERKRAEQAVVSYNERLKILHRIDRALIAGEELAAIAEAVLPLVRDLLGVGRVVVNLLNPATGEVEWLAAVGRRRVRVGPGVRYTMEFMGDVAALRRGEHQVIDIRALPPGAEVDALLASDIRSYVVVPMLTGGELVGALSFGGTDLPLTTDQIAIAREIATQFAIALYQARLHECVKRQAQELAERNRTLTTLIDASPLAIIVVDLDGCVKLWSRAAEEIFGWPAADVLGRPIPIVPPELQNELGALLARESDGRAMAGLETYRLRRDGSRVDVAMSAAPLRGGADGSITGALRILGDISGSKKLEEQFRQAQKMEAIGRLAGGIAHDFNNLLTIIAGYSDMLLDRMPLADPGAALVEEIRRAGERAAALTRQLLAFSRKAILEPKVLDLRVIVIGVDAMLRRLIGEDIALSVTADPDLGAVRADPGQIEQVILNLAVNARDAMPRGGRIRIEARNVEPDEAHLCAHPAARPGPHVLLTVHDTGCGMDAATMARIFEPFFTTKADRGTGLGLATVHGIVKQAGGHVVVHSEVGQGSAFDVYLPCAAERPQPGPAAHGTTALPRGGETVLLVEDEDAVRALTRQVLQGCGYTVLEARDGVEALQVAAAAHPGKIDLLATDVVMPRMGGRELAERAAALHPALKVLFLSGYTDDAVVRHGILEADVAFLHKPFTPATLAAKVRAILDEA